MIGPLFLIYVPLVAILLIVILSRIRPNHASLPIALLIAALALLVAIPAGWVLPLFGREPIRITAKALPLELRMSGVEAVILTLISLIALLSVVTNLRSFALSTPARLVGPLVMLLGGNGLLLAGDLLTAFLSLVILFAGAYGMLVADLQSAQSRVTDTSRQLPGAHPFGYLIAGGITCVLFLAGALLVAQSAGSVNIAEVVRVTSNVDAAENSGRGAGLFGPFLLFAALLLALRPFPANGWGGTAYEAARPPLDALLTSVAVPALLLLLERLLLILPVELLTLLAWVGSVTFFAGNLAGFHARAAKQLFSLTAISQSGLVSAALALTALDGLGRTAVIILAGGLLVNHMLAKAGLLWIAGIGSGSSRPRRVGPVLGVAAVALGLAVTGLPPFPGFWARWQLVHLLVRSERMVILGLFVAGSLLEAIAVFGWMSRVIAAGGPESSDETTPSAVIPPAHRVAQENDSGGAGNATHEFHTGQAETRAAAVVRAPAGTSVGLLLVVLLLGASGIFTGWTLGLNDRVIWAPFFFALAVLALEWAPPRIRAIAVAGAIGFFAWLVYPLVTGIPLLFAGVFAGGAVLAAATMMTGKAMPFGTGAFLVLSGTALTGLVTAGEPLAFVLLWQLMTAGVYLLLARSGRTGAAAASRRYLAFSCAAALLVVVGLTVAGQAWTEAQGAPVPELAGADGYVRLPLLRNGVGDSTGPSARTGGLVLSGGVGAWAAGIPPGTSLRLFALLALGFLLSLGAIGLHVWLPDSLSALEKPAGAFFLATLLSAGVLGLLLLLIMVGSPGSPSAGESVLRALGWVGLATALAGALAASLQHTPRRLLASIVMGQLGFVMLGIALASRLGWVAALYQVVLVAAGAASMLFMIAQTESAVVSRRGARGLDSGPTGSAKAIRMNAIVGVLAAFTVTGLPPFAGFWARWMLLEALIQSGWIVLAGLALIASVISLVAVLRLVLMFLANEAARDGSAAGEGWVSALQVLLLGGLLLIGGVPSLLVDAIDGGVAALLELSTQAPGALVTRALQQWSGGLGIVLTALLLFGVLTWFYLRNRHAGRPRLQTAARVIRGYEQALGFLAVPLADRTWQQIRKALEWTSDRLRRHHHGSVRRHAVQMVAFLVALLLIALVL